MKLKIAVFFGGESVEHEVSIISGHQAMAALDKSKYDVIPVYISKDRKFYCSPLLEDMKNYTDLNALIRKCTQVMLVNEDNQVLIKPAKGGLFQKPISSVDVAVPVVHGTNGEDGTLQGFLEMLKVPYAGCSVVAAAIGQDKVLQKYALAGSGLPITDWFWCYGSEMEEKKQEILDQVHRIGYPVILKPACTGSSVGINVAHSDEEYWKGFEDTATFDFKVITEQMVKPLREINCSVLGDSFYAQASVLEEVGKGTQDELLTYKDKYQGGGKGAKQSGASKGMASTTRIVPAPLSEEQTKTIKDLALKTFKALGSSGVARIDFMMNGDTGRIYVNEINTIPGSLAFYLWQEEGVSFSELMDRLIKLALDRQRRQSKMTFSYDTNLLATYNAGGVKGGKGAKR
jgi:D-alanine-D-alanine ligase